MKTTWLEINCLPPDKLIKIRKDRISAFHITDEEITIEGMGITALHFRSSLDKFCNYVFRLDVDEFGKLQDYLEFLSRG